MFNQVGPLEIVVVLGIVLLVFGPKRLPQAGRALGRSMREFKESLTAHHDSDELEEGQKAAAPATGSAQESTPAASSVPPHEAGKSDSNGSA